MGGKKGKDLILGFIVTWTWDHCSSATDKYLKLHLFLCLFSIYFACACACVFVSIYAWAYLCAQACTSVCAYMCTYEHVFVHMFACLHMCMCVFTCAHAISWVWRSETTCLSSCRTELCSLNSGLQIWWQFLLRVDSLPMIVILSMLNVSPSFSLSLFLSLMCLQMV